jgi:hypothetical protein
VSFWKPENRREWLLERGIAFELSQVYDESKPMGSWAHSQVGVIAMAHLVNLGSSMIDIAPRCVDWIDRAIARGEDMGPDRLAWYGLLLESKALAQWFMARQNPTATWNEAFDSRLATQARHAGEQLTAKDRNSVLDDVVAIGYQAGRYAEAIAFHDALAGPMKVSVPNIKAPRQLAYALCQRARGHSPGSEEEIIRAGHRLLQIHMAERWLHLGNYQRTAMWLKIVHEVANPGLTPAEVMLKAYDDMPTVPRPAFLPA